jgi:hypothetical protein
MNNLALTFQKELQFRIQVKRQAQNKKQKKKKLVDEREILTPWRWAGNAVRNVG